MLLRKPRSQSPRAIQRDTVVVPGNTDQPPIEVQRVRDPRARRIRLSVDERGARLTLPLRASLMAGDHFLTLHHSWLHEQLARHTTPQSAQWLQPYVTTSLPLRGRSVPLHWHDGRYTRIDLHDDGVHIQRSPHSSKAALARALREFYETQGHADVARWIPHHLSGLPRTPRRVRFKLMSSQWGSLSPDGNISLDLSLVLGKPSAFEYVVVHELCHLAQPNHSAAFWREVEQRFPHWREQRDYFHTEGRVLKAQTLALLQA